LSFGRYHLKLSEHEFWHLTLAQLDALVKRHTDEQERQDYRAALICAVLANINRKKNSRTFQPRDFMPSKRPLRPSPEELRSKLDMAMYALGARKGKKKETK